MIFGDILLVIIICLFLYKPVLWVISKIMKQEKKFEKDIEKITKEK